MKERRRRQRRKPTRTCKAFTIYHSARQKPHGVETIPSLDHKADKAVYNIGAKRYTTL